MPSQARFSGSDEADTHGQKLYFLFAKDRSSYLFGDKKKPAPIGQVVVKESWQPVELTGDDKPRSFHWRDIQRDKQFTKEQKEDNTPFAFAGSYFPYARKGDKLYRAEKKIGLVHHV